MPQKQQAPESVDFTRFQGLFFIGATGFEPAASCTGNIPSNQLLFAKDYMGEKRKNQIVLFLPLGTKDRWRDQADKAEAKTLTQYIIQLIEQDAEKNQRITKPPGTISGGDYYIQHCGTDEHEPQ